MRQSRTLPGVTSRRLIAGALLSTAALLFAGCMFGAQAQRGGNFSDSSCDTSIPAITSGYGADGPYGFDMQSLDNPALPRKPVLVFLPKGAEGKRPVIFFSHGYGPGKWESYGDFIKHIVSRGYIVVFSSYPMLFASNDERYDDLWSGFLAAAKAYGARIDLAHAGFVGHSFGGGATPAMAYKGIVQQGWGKQGTFMMELAPWYSFEITDAQMQQIPHEVPNLLEVYDRDSINDHRMAIDLYRNSHANALYYFVVQSMKVGNCDIVADHMTPARGDFTREKQYGVFRPFDALADAAFNGSAAAREALATMGAKPAASPYQPIAATAQPVPLQPESYYHWGWSDGKNPRR